MKPLSFIGMANIENNPTSRQVTITSYRLVYLSSYYRCIPDFQQKNTRHTKDKKKHNLKRKKEEIRTTVRCDRDVDFSGRNLKITMDSLPNAIMEKVDSMKRKW